MRCSRARKLISDYIDGFLSTKKSLKLEQHLQSCPDCQIFLKEFKDIASQAGNLNLLTPSDDVWIKIKANIREAQQKSKTSNAPRRTLIGYLHPQTKLRFALNIVLLFIIVGAVFSGMLYWSGREDREKKNVQKYALKHLKEAERHYQLAIKALNKAISEKDTGPDIPITEIYRKNLEIVDASIKVCRQTIKEEPDNLEMRDYILSIYKQKIALLNELMKVKQKSL
jgi:predicted anti-sigma-YlaC factor YlaD